MKSSHHSSLPRHMVGFIDYVVTLEEMAVSGHASPAAQFAPALDGEAGCELRRLVDLAVRRSYGAFFTGSELARRLVDKAPRGVAKFYDPSCGAGDLLLAAARRLPMAESLRATIRLWSTHLGGRDLHPEFVRSTKARLVLLARARGVFAERLSTDVLRTAFPAITVGNGLDLAAVPKKAGVVLLNPPYSPVPAPAGCAWAAGKLNVAAIFVDHYVQKSPAGTRVLAILPDVLRSGSNYRKWRGRIAEAAATLELEACGLFDANADVDVFMLGIVKKGGEGTRRVRWPARRRTARVLEHFFDVSVGAVVPHRHRKIGIMRRFLDARSAPSFGVVRRVKERRKFKGPVVAPPFVTIKRTSRPGDRHRANATLVTGTRPVAVENHLIVCRPKDGTVKTCSNLVTQLQATAVSKWLNTTIRCRHLTVGAVRLIRLG